MAPTPATMTVNFTSNYNGPHRVCWRIGNSGPYDCSTIVNCPGLGNPCQAVIPITVDNNTCSPVNFNGYVQAACELEASLNGRIPFSVDFIPNPDCKKWDVTCSAVGVTSYTVTSPGGGYTPGSNPPLSIVGGGGSGAAAYGVVGDGGVKTFTITNGGAGYLGGGSGTITGVPAQNISGVGVGATFDVTVTLGVITAIAFSASPTSPGVNYAATDTFEFNNAFLGGTGAGVIITVNTINTGEIQYVMVTAPGAGYSSVPSATITPPGGGTAPTLVAVLGPCTDFVPGPDCSGFDPGVLGNRPLGFVYKSCAAVAPVAPSGWVVAENGCCYDCVNVTFTNNGIVPVNVTYTSCLVSPPAGGTITALPPGVPTLITCVVNNSWMIPQAASVSVSAPVPAVCP